MYSDSYNLEMFGINFKSFHCKKINNEILKVVDNNGDINLIAQILCLNCLYCNKTLPI